ncbi:uncharacterized protein MELLADRAFT_49864 [Melampsora larici-populina 98AG31]|uniref:Protein-S-isoprenylcysteine O-methyltransferase n=1 Tax=Melampsora larici-populina (strain 98AG31 / pathotype 3-4-7) TaxID=747676 RepID=F4RZ63_MELLP|nr:uncharacterized protein MELLADRAFT_49864 [Melampsora larici-populina 98AG31]EGG02371.1 hypothetical protein MELLADRAFT_49864 [Melampsora larici-populina 98AG31]
MSNKLTKFERNPPMWSDSDSSSSSSSSEPEPESLLKKITEEETETRISFPLTSFDNTIQNVSAISFMMGNLMALNILCLLTHQFHHYYKLNLYCLVLIVFHFFEFMVTAIWNHSRVTVNSFLLNNGIEYWLAHLFSITEYLIMQTIYHKRSSNLLDIFSITIIILCQLIRTLSMITAAQSFNHKVSTSKTPDKDHTLITNGIYNYLRHPSYFGFFYWSIGLQIYFRNWCSFFLFFGVLWNFFNKRIQNEEMHLIKFFGKDYLDYKSRTGIYIPFIR